MNFNGCTKSVRKEIEAMRDTHLENSNENKRLDSQKRVCTLSKYLFFFSKVSLKNNKASK